MSLEQLHTNQLSNTLKGDIQKCLEESFIGTMASSITGNEITETCYRYLREFLNKQNTYHDDFKHISFEGQLNLESSSYEFIPSNFFTALLFQGIYFPGSLYGVNVVTM